MTVQTPNSSAGNPLARASWNPYLVGAGIGLLSWAVFALVDSPLGITTALSQVSAAACLPIAGAEAMAQNPYWAKHMPKWDYGTLFLIGTALGALASALAGRTARIETVPQVWRERFGPSRSKRLLAAFVGGMIIMYGARMAGGCTSGNGLSGSLQLALSGWTFFLTMFIAGVLTAWALFGTPRPSR